MLSICVAKSTYCHSVFVQIVKYYEPQFENYNECVCVCVYSQRFPCSRCGLVSPSSLCVRCGVATIASIAYCCYYCCFCSFALFHCSHFERIIRSICASDLNCKLFTPAARSFEIVQCFPKQMNI